MIGGLAGLTGVGVSAFVLGLVMAFSPTNVGVEIHVLATGSDRRDVPRIVAAVMVGALALCVLPALVSEATLRAVWHGRVEELLAERAVDLVAGLLIAGAGLHQWRRAGEPRTPNRRPEDRVLFPFVLANTVLSASGAATAYLVIRLITGSGLDWWLWPVVYAVFLTAVAAPYLTLAWGWNRFPGVAAHVDAAVRWVAGHDWHRAVGAALVAVGALLVLASLTGYFGRA